MSRATFRVQDCTGQPIIMPYNACCGRFAGSPDRLTLCLQLTLQRRVVVLESLPSIDFHTETTTEHDAAGRNRSEVPCNDGGARPPAACLWQRARSSALPQQQAPCEHVLCSEPTNETLNQDSRLRTSLRSAKAAQNRNPPSTQFRLGCSCSGDAGSRPTSRDGTASVAPGMVRIMPLLGLCFRTYLGYRFRNGLMVHAVVIPSWHFSMPCDVLRTQRYAHQSDTQVLWHGCCDASKPPSAAPFQRIPAASGEAMGKGGGIWRPWAECA